MSENITDLSVFHEVPYENIRGAYVKISHSIDHAYLPHADPRKSGSSATEEIREGTIVGRGEGRGIRYDSSGENAYMETRIGPSIYLDTPDDTILEIRTDKPGNELIDFTPSEKYE